jgi:hypothetical protein
MDDLEYQRHLRELETFGESIKDYERKSNNNNELMEEVKRLREEVKKLSNLVNSSFAKISNMNKIFRNNQTKSMSKVDEK